MKRIDTATRAVDLFGAGKHGFRNGDLANGNAPTDFNADWPNNLQEEVANVIEAAGIALDGNVRTQLLAALRSAGAFQTPPQFDYTTKAATTAFVRNSGMQYRGILTQTAAVTFAAADVLGAAIDLRPTVATTYTLPNTTGLAAIAYGGQAVFTNSGTANATIAVNAPGTEKIVLGVSLPTSVLLEPGDTLVLSLYSSSFWYASAGTAQLRYAPAFSKNLAASGFQRVPGGYLRQWGTITPGAANTPIVGTFPTTFPNACLNIVGSISNIAGTGAYPVNIGQTSASQYRAVCPNVDVIQWQAIGW